MGSRSLRKIPAAWVLLALACAPVWANEPVRPWSVLDPAQVIAVAAGSGNVTLATLQAERARLAAEGAGAIVSGSLRTGAEAAWRAEDAGPAGPEGWDTSLGAIALSTDWVVVPAGPAYDAAQRAVRSLGLALDALADARRDAILDVLERVVTLERLAAQVTLAEGRLDLALRSRDVVAEQLAAGTVAPAAVADADLSVLQAEGEAATARADVAAARIAFERAYAVAVDALWTPAADPLGTLQAAAEAAAVDPSPPITLDHDEFEAAVTASDRVREALHAVDDAATALERARREAGVALGLSARVANTSDAGRVTVGAAWDSRSLQPSADLSYDPWNPADPQTTATLEANLSWAFGGDVANAVAQAEIDQALALERLRQARSAAALELENLLRADEQARRAAALAAERHAQRLTQLASVRVRADLGQASPLDLRRAELDAFDAALALLRADDQARSARLRLEAALDRSPSFDPIAAVLAAVPTEVR
jgi:outer membrane protein TolC